MTYIEILNNAGVSVPECYKKFRADEEFDQFSGMIINSLDKETYSETTEVHFDWDEYMFEEFFDSDIAEYIPIGILHDTEIIDDTYLTINASDPMCAVFHCEIDGETSEVQYEQIADSLTSFLETLEYPEENYIDFLETKFKTTLPERYKNFMKSYEYVDFNGEKKFNDSEILFNEFPNLQWAAENFNKDTLKWLPLASIGEDHNEFNDVIAIKMGTEDCPVYFINGEEEQLLSNSLNEFLA